MISAKYHDATKTSYHFFRTDGSEGDAYPSHARWEDIEEERIKAKITPDPYVGPTALELWKESMSQSDQTMMPRWLEDHIQDDHGGISGNATLQKKYNDKKTLRGKKPL